MGTVVFPSANLKIFLTASIEERAKRRHKQLISKGIGAMLPDLLRDLGERDKRDTERSISPLKPANDAVILDSTNLDVEEVVNKILQRFQKLCLKLKVSCKCKLTGVLPGNRQT